MKSIILFFFFVSILLISCSPEPKPINFGQDECVLCKMIIAQKPWGAEIVTKKYNTLEFDAVECMAKYINDGLIDTASIHSYWVVDYSHQGELINVREALFLHSKSLPSPMNLYLTSFSSRTELDRTMKIHTGKVLNWDEVKEMVREKWRD